MRAIEPTSQGRLTISGFGIGYEVFGDDQSPPLLLMPGWQTAPSRQWKMQIPFLARRFRVVVWDPPGCGAGERTTDPAAYSFDNIVGFAVGLLDHLSIERLPLVAFSKGSIYALLMAARFPERVSRMVLIASCTDDWNYRVDPSFWEARDHYDGWEKRNAHYWRSNYRDWLDFFFGQVCNEPHSSKLVDDFTSWALETTPEILIASVENPALVPEMTLDEALGRVRCPVLLIHGTDDRIASVEASRSQAEALPEFELLEIDGGSHAITGRQPVVVNQEITRFLGVPWSRHRSWPRAMSRAGRRALFISSPIGLGHVQRDLAIARELRRIEPNLRIDWLAQPPVSEVLLRSGETIHPLSRELASESSHWESFAGEHRLHAFHAFREMDEVLAANFMVFLDAVRETPYDLWLGDEAWEVDHYLHENPELKRAPYVFMTDFVGWLPIDGSAGSREAALTADYNLEMLEHVERFPRLRDRALYFGEYEDLPPERFGPGLPSIPEWTAEHFSATGYVVPFDPGVYAEIASVRARLGYDATQPLIIGAAGGTSAGRHLLRKIAAAWPLIQQAKPDARCVIVAGPRIDAGEIPLQLGLEVRPYVHNLYEHLAVADLGIVQGGLGTTMELAVTRRPFLYFPLAEHSEQVYHVAHRLWRMGAGRRLDYARTTPEEL
ncbi:MAG TPA: alpha/beta fold hydrolase, partial [Thermomicrobiaceae bacterium]|nr:alpha/beta fold hydrolase [Thermomicrobiaceae bacterium]